MDQQQDRLGSRELAKQLRDEIAREDLAPGTKLRSYRELASEHGISVNTAREAVRILEQEGRVVIRHGSGAFVAEATEKTAEDQLRDLRVELEDVRQQLRQTTSALAATEERLSEVVDRIPRGR
ncbi:winged helix-turn-helix domain-containing protein [Saccharopolyspora sp. NPDC050642]|uniref:GntR family transcriptional regulator n=1 Tax=Saccharopolyspora sp. NPDC050642 TaxID=3157099 RepID=UPI0033DA7505